ncbi:cell division protein ZapA [uncultured Erythrobacter sp.]|uniref:cell division protein ZapA n=1 Tax=uncultured Erythrobacter sp. TaxID=263913 RepID=UPI0026596D58|nr:cell division protein ZapA [uncultured Erythrobacter sp.]
MSTVTLNIGPKTYTIACADGEEAHIEGLGAMIAEKYALLGASRAPLEAQNLLFAALFLADELAEARKRGGGTEPVVAPHPDTAEADALRETIAQLEDELEAMRKAAAAAAAAPQPDLFVGAAAAEDVGEAVAEQLEALAARIEACATALEAAAPSA